MPDSARKFGDFELDSARYELRRGDQALRLEKLPMDLLTILVESGGQLVTRDQIIEKIWGKDVFLDTEHGINTAIRKIRQALADDPNNPRFVQTITGKGYRFIAPISVVSPAANGNGGGSSSPLVVEQVLSGAGSEKETPALASFELEDLDSSRLRTRSRLRLWRTAAVVLIGAGALCAVVIGFNIRHLRDRIFAIKPHIQSLAVLPLENLTADPAQDYFADGMTDEIITMLAKNPGLRVTSRTSVMQYKKAHRPLREIARELGVDGILEGSVERSGNRVHLNAQLIYAPEDRHLWAESYDRDLSDVGALQSDLAHNIAQQVGLTASPATASVRVIKPEAHDAYLMGRYLWFASDYKRGEEYFQKAIQIQPDYAAAWAGVADYYTASAVEEEIPPALALAQAEPAAHKAIALDDSLAEAHHAMAAADYFLRWDWNNAEREVMRAIQLNPQLAESHHLHAYILQTLGRTEESVAEDRKAMELDPFARPWALGFALLRARRYDEALSELQSRKYAQPYDCAVHSLLSDLYLEKAMPAEYLSEMQTCMSPKSREETQQAFEKAGLRGVLQWNLDRIQKTALTERVSPLDLARAYWRLGRQEEAIQYLNQAYDEHLPWLVQLQSEPEMEALHLNPRYQELARKIGLPDVRPR